MSKQVKDFCELGEYSIEEIERLIEQAGWLQRQSSVNKLQGKVLV